MFKSSLGTTNPSDRTLDSIFRGFEEPKLFVWIPAMTKPSGLVYNFLCRLLRSCSQGVKCARRWSPAFSGGAGMQYRGRREPGQLSPLFFTLAQILKIFEWEAAENNTCNQQRNLRRRISKRNHHRWGRKWLYAKRWPQEEQEAAAREHRHFLARSPPAVRAREASHRACAQDGRWLAFPRRLAVPAGVKNCVTRSKRGGHLRLQGTSAEPVRAEEERCASAPETVTGNSHLTGEASSSSPEVWRFCAAGKAAVAAEAAECLLVPGCEAVCRLAVDPRLEWARYAGVPTVPAACCRAACVLSSLLPALWRAWRFSPFLFHPSIASHASSYSGPGFWRPEREWAASRRRCLR